MLRKRPTHYWVREEGLRLLFTLFKLESLGNMSLDAFCHQNKGKYYQIAIAPGNEIAGVTAVVD